MISLVYAELAFVTLACVVLLALWLGRTLGTADGTASAKRSITAVVLAILAWLLLTAIFAQTGFLSEWDATPPRFPIVPLFALAVVAITTRTPAFRIMLANTPLYFPIAFQTFRVGVELAFWGLHALGKAPVQVTFEGRNFDVIVGLTAPVMAFAVARYRLRPASIIAWNLAGLAILSNTIVTTITSLPGPLHHNWPDGPFTAFGAWPFVWIPAFLAPLAICLHIFSIRQNLIPAAMAVR